MKNSYQNLINYTAKIFLGFATVSVIAPVSVSAIEFPDVPERNPPKSTAAGGRRGGCVTGNLPIKALTPGDDNKFTTVSSQPNIYVYLPKTKAKLAQFVLTEEGGKEINVQEITIDNEGDYVTQISLPEDINLKEGKTYQWEISLVCNPMFINSGNYTKGMIKVVSLSPESKNQLASAESAIAQAEIYAKEKIWGETITLVAKERESQPQQWQQLLKSVGLQDYVDKEFASN